MSVVHTSYNLNETRVDLTSCTHMFLSFHTQLHSLFIIFMYRATYMRIHHLFTCRVLFYTHTHVLAVMRIITTCTFIDLSQLDQVTHATAYKFFDQRRGLLLIANAYN